MKKIPLLLALLVIAVGVHTLSGNVNQRDMLTAQVVNSKEEAPKEEEAKGEVPVEEGAKGEVPVEEGAKGEVPVEEGAKGEVPVEDSSEYDILVASINACEINPSEKSFAAQYVDTKIISQTEADTLWASAKCGAEEEPSEYDILVASIGACEINPSEKSFAAQYVDTRIISQEEADTLWASAKCGAEEEPSEYDILVASIGACEINPSEKGFAAQYVDTRIISQEQADQEWKDGACDKEPALDSKTILANIQSCELAPDSVEVAGYVESKIIAQEQADQAWKEGSCAQKEVPDPKTILATIEGDCLPGLNSEEMKSYLESRVVAQEDIKISWKTGNCDTRVKNRELEKEMIRSFNEKELTQYLIEKEKAVQGDYLPEFIAKYVDNWSNERTRKSNSSSNRRTGAELKIAQTEPRTLSNDKEDRTAKTAESFAPTTTQLASAPAPVVITSDKPIAIPFTSQSESSGGSRSGNDYRVDEETSEETLEILENISIDSCFSEYIRPRSPFNDINEVRKWQNFLNDYMGEDLRVTGVYNQATQQAVRDFQEQYSEFVLEPWNLQEPTSFVYKTTRSMANYIIGCPEGELFLDDLGVNYSHLDQQIKLR